jgi:hypothetical protein
MSALVVVGTAVAVILGGSMRVWAATPATLQDKLSAGDPAVGAHFGWSVSISGDTAIVGAPQRGMDCCPPGAAYVFVANAAGGNVWKQVAKLTASDQDGPVFNFGDSVAISGDTAVVGAPGSGTAYVFARDHGGPDAWGQVAKLTTDVPHSFLFGWAVDIDGEFIIVGDSGVAFVFFRNSGGVDAWGQVAALTPGDPAVARGFGIAVSIRGGFAAVGASEDNQDANESGAAYIYFRHRGGPDAWGQAAKLKALNISADAHFGQSVSLGADGIVVGAPGTDRSAGAAHVFVNKGGTTNTWFETVTLRASLDAGFVRFGHSVSVRHDLIVVGAYSAFGRAAHTGAAYLFGRDRGGPENWGELAKVAAADIVHEGTGVFGLEVSTDGTRALVGAYGAEAAYACELDELDDPGAACGRAPVNQLVSLSGVTTSCCAGSEFVITARLTNTSGIPLPFPYFRVIALSGGNVLSNADDGPGGVGSRLTPDVADGILSPRETTVVRFSIALATRKPFLFLVNVLSAPPP